MSLQIAFWVIMIVLAVFSLWSTPSAGGIKGYGGTLLLFVLFALLGWQVFGAAIHR